MKPCPRSIDKPFLFLGLELEEIGAVFLIFFFMINVTYFSISVLASVLTWIWIYKTRKGKPDGAFLHSLYKLGIPFEGFLPPLKKGKEKYSCFSKKSKI